MKLTVIGLGYKKSDITIEAYDAIKNADTVIVKSSLYELPEVVLAREYIGLDYIYENAENFSELDIKIAAEVKKLARGNTVYLVCGNGAGDYSLKHLSGYKLIKGVSLIPNAVHNSYTVMSAYEIAETDRINFNTDIPLVISELDNPMLTGDVKLKLLDVYAEDTYIEIGGKQDILENLDRQKKYSYSTYAIIYPSALLEKKRFTLNDLTCIMDMLCGENGCPWDKVQTHESIKINIIEEAYEAVDAIDSGSLLKMSEEFGDLLLQAVFQSAIAERAGEFNLTDVITDLCKKIIYRHTHVFGAVKAADATDALKSWDAAKTKEKGQSKISDAIADVPDIFPSLLRAVKVQSRAKKGGLDFASIDDAKASLMSEIKEFADADSAENKYHEMGDILFSVCNVARLSGIAPETALNSSIAKFTERFRFVEEQILLSGRTMQSLSAAELDGLWNESKKSIMQP